MFLSANNVMPAMIEPPIVDTKNGTTNVKMPICAAVFPINQIAIGYESIPPKIPVPKTSPTRVGNNFLEYLNTSAESRAPTIEPGNARGLPSPARFLIREAINATKTFKTGPKNTAPTTFTKC